MRTRDVPASQRLLAARSDSGREDTFRADGELDRRRLYAGLVEKFDSDGRLHDLLGAGEREGREGAEHIFVGLSMRFSVSTVRVIESRAKEIPYRHRHRRQTLRRDFRRQCV